jgi:two-component system, NarL family, sensor histidine kinase BarA
MSRLGDGSLVYDSHSLSHRIVSVFVLIGIVILALTFLILYGNESRSVQNEYSLIQNYTEHDIRIAVGLLLDREHDLDYLYQKLSDDFSRRVPGISSIRIFDPSIIIPGPLSDGNDYLSAHGISLTEHPDRISVINQVFNTKRDLQISESESGYRKYLYVAPFFVTNASLPEGGKVIEITYTTHVLQEQQTGVLVKYLLGAVICIAGLLIGALLITRYITQPVELIIRDIEQISEGEYDHPIRHTRGYEFDRLEASIGKMVHRLKDDIIAIRKKSEELDHELHMRAATERSLRSANQKLNLLGTITRHDILNQLTVITGALDLIEGEGDRDPEHARLYDLIHRSVVTIHKQISFTRVYEQMGTEDPIWSLTSSIINKATDEISLAGVRVEDRTGPLEILADPMIDRVIVNLMENAVRHGGHVTHITLDFQIQGDHGLLLIQDNGRGVAAGEKEKIFDRGYGSNTGLGLFLVREILAITGFTIRETGTSGMGACFSITIPPGYWRMGHG